MTPAYRPLYLSYLSVLFLLCVCVFVSGKNENSTTLPILSGTLKGNVQFIELKNSAIRILFDIPNPEKYSFVIFDGAVPFSEDIKVCRDLTEQAITVQALESITPSGFTTSKNQILGNTLGIYENYKLIACVAVVTSTYPFNNDLSEVLLSSETINGRIYALALNQTAFKLLPDLGSTKRHQTLKFDLISDCDDDNAEKLYSGSLTIGTTQSTIVSFDDQTLYNKLHVRWRTENNDTLCSTFTKATPLEAFFDSIIISQQTSFVPPIVNKQISGFNVSTDCKKREVISEIQSHGRYLMTSLFSSDPLFFKKALFQSKCETVLPYRKVRTLMTTFAHPVVGSLFLVNFGRSQAVASDLRNIFDTQASAGSLLLSSLDIENDGCESFIPSTELDVPIPLRSSKDKNGVFSFSQMNMLFSFESVRSVQVNLGWSRICANVVLLSEGAIEASVSLRSHNVASSAKLMKITIHEYVFENISEIIMDDGHCPKISLFQRPIDRTLHSGATCTTPMIGSVVENSELEKVLQDKSSSVLPGHVLTGNNSILGSSLSSDDCEGSTACGTIKTNYPDGVTAFAKFNESINGYIKMQQEHPPYNLIVPTEVSYYLESTVPTAFSNTAPKIDWEIVYMNAGSNCHSAITYDPHRVQDHNLCGDDVDFCPMGKMSNRSSLLSFQSKEHFLIFDSPNLHEIAAANTHIRLRTDNNDTVCAPLRALDSAYAKWTVLSSRNLSLSGLQQDFANRLHLEPLQVGIDFTRQFTGNFCTTFDVELLLTPDEKQRFNKEFNGSKKKFNSDADINCYNADQTTDTSPLNSSQSQLHLSNHLLVVCILVVYSTIS